MGTVKYITGYGIWKPGLKKFTDELNAHLATGVWEQEGDVRPNFHGLFGRKYMLIAKLVKVVK